MNNKILINTVRCFPFLYDSNHDLYNDHTKKAIAWKRIDDKLHVPRGDCKKAWCQLRDAYRRIIVKRSQNDVNQTHKKWKYENDMNFLKPYLKNLPLNVFTADDFEEEKDESSLDMSANSCDSILSARSSTSVSENITEAIESSALLTKFILQMKKKDELDIIFAALAGTVRRFPQPEQALAKAKISLIVNQMEIILESGNTLTTADIAPSFKEDFNEEDSDEMEFLYT